VPPAASDVACGNVHAVLKLICSRNGSLASTCSAHVPWIRENEAMYIIIFISLFMVYLVTLSVLGICNVEWWNDSK
jgi:hypothetical protein